ncbi:MAG: hypothetical protein KBD78_12920 [Oligoflexales bacterium]|nr:hypothetical protein [Oligoflexales bacterium]
MNAQTKKDYETFKEVSSELLNPIDPMGLDAETLKRLYESKYVYLENIRGKCFRNMNQVKPYSLFSQEDYQLILSARDATNFQLKKLILVEMHTKLGRRKAS